MRFSILLVKLVGVMYNCAAHTRTTALPQERQTRSIPPYFTRSYNINRSKPSDKLADFPNNHFVPSLPTQQPLPLPTTTQSPTIISVSPMLLNKSTLLMSFAFLAAVGDVVCHRRYDCYAGIMSGNVIHIARALAELRWRDAARPFFVLFSYTCGLVSYRNVYVRSKKNTDNSPLRASRDSCGKLVFPVIFLFAIEDYLNHKSGGRMLPQILNNVPIFLAYAYGLINGAAASSTGGIVSFAITGHVNKLGNAIIDYSQLIPKKRKEKERWRRENKVLIKSYKRSFSIFCMFALGVLVATVLGREGTLGMHMPSCMVKSPFVVLGLVYAVLLSFIGKPTKGI